MSALLAAAGCQQPPAAPAPLAPEPVAAAAPLVREGYAFVLAGESFDAGTRVVTFREPGGFDAYAIPVAAAPTATPYENHGARRFPDPAGGEPAELAVPATLEQLRGLVDQVVLHYDSEGLSRRTFPILQKRERSAHFLVDVDGTVYQTLDMRERAYHATIANSRSIGIEIANLGAYPPGETQEAAAWYQPAPDGTVVMQAPPDARPRGVLTPDFVARPDRPEPVSGAIHGAPLVQYDFTPEQYAALAHLLAALHRALPAIALDAPREADGQVAARQLTADEFARFRGLIGHFHIQANKVDPGPALQWERLIAAARARASAQD
ncbi:MAG: N-acetylmuramoyl-L-alanine amidase [Cephaloticoccus sp.]